MGSIGLIWLTVIIIGITWLIAVAIHEEYNEHVCVKQERIEQNKRMVLLDLEIANASNMAYVTMDKDTYEIYRKELDAMINFYTTTHTDILYGQCFNDNKGVYAQISNDDILDIIGEVGEEIIKDLSVLMRDFLYTYLGRSWTQKYIKTKTLSVTLVYVAQKNEELNSLQI